VPRESGAVLEALPLAYASVKARREQASRPPPDPVEFAATAGLPPDPWQADVLRSSSPRILLNCSRQSGKSTISSVLAVHKAVYRPHSLVLLLSPALRQSSELFKKCLATYRALGRPVQADSETALTVTLANGSRIISLPGKEGTIRGYSGVDLLLIDEASRVMDDLYRSVRPMLAVSGGTLVAMSTPWGKRGWWYEAWTQGGPAWERYRVTATDCPRISPEFLAEEKRSMPDWFYDQEYGCEFRDTTSQIFPTDLIMGAIRDDIVPLFGGPPSGPDATQDGDGPELLFGGVA
jgi:hypothetical protein